MKKNSYSGKFIVFEGLDGSGLSTQAELLKKYLEEKGFKVLLTKEPTKNSSVSSVIDDALSHKIRLERIELQKLFAQDRREHLENLIIPALKDGQIVISDRYFFSSFAFGPENKKEMEEIINLNKDFLMPDLTILLKVSPEICLKRIKMRGEEIKLFEKLEKLKKVWLNYQEVAKMFPRIVIVNGEPTKQEVHSQIINIVNQYFNLK